MNPFTQKIAIIILACTLTLNVAVGATVEVAPCPPHICCGGTMDMGHHNGMLNFALPSQGCCEGCNNSVCDFMKDPLQDINAVNSSNLQGHSNPVILRTGDFIGPTGLRASMSENRRPLSEFWATSQIPLYIEHLSLII